MVRDSAEKQKKKAKEMLGISDDRADEIFEEQPDRKQQKKQELEEKGKLDQDEAEEKKEQSGEQDSGEKNQVYLCEECGDEFDSKQGLASHKGQVH